MSTRVWKVKVNITWPLNSVSQETQHLFHLASSTVEGYCRGIAAGSRKISLSVWTSPYDNRGSYDTVTGWKAYSRLVVEEFREGDNKIAGATESP